MLIEGTLVPCWWQAYQYSNLGVLCSVERKSNMVIKPVPFENKQSLQIGILEELAISLVAFLVPASSLTGLISPMLASKST
jgi:hypothetical protein